MGVRDVEELRAWQHARAFKLEVYRLLAQSREAQIDQRYRHQLADAASGGEANIAEGFRRFLATDFARFVSYAVASIEEATRRLQDGVDRGYFTAASAHHGLQLGRTAGRTSMALLKSLRRLRLDRGARRLSPAMEEGPRASDERRTKDRTTD